MKKRINQLIKCFRLCAALILILLPVGCNDQVDDVVSREGTLIQLTVSAPSNAVETRVKSSFAEGDVIWIDASFKSSTISSGTYKLTLKGGKWLTDSYGEFRWPEDAASGTFKAYFVGNETINSGSLTIDTSRLTDEEGKDDPLFAETGEIAVGGAVHLLFAHTLTKLCISGLPATTSTVTWKGLGTKTIIFTKGAGYSFPASAENGVFDVKDKKAVCFLHVTNDGIPEMLLAGTTEQLQLPPAIQSKLKSMKPGRAYALHFGAGGQNANLIELNRWWEEKPDCVPAIKLSQLQITAFLNAWKAGNAYEITQDGKVIKILEAITRKLLICVDFQNLEFTSIELDTAIDGDYHTIYNVNLKNSGFFSSVTKKGSISHLALENVTIKPAQALIGPIGTLAGLNQGELTDVHLKGISVLDMKGYAATIGGMIGKNEGKLDGLSVSGQLTIKHSLVAGNDNFTGGMIGENSASLNRCVVSGAVKIITMGTTTKDAHIGGLAGTLQGVTTDSGQAPVSGCVSNAQIDASAATANNLYTGGFCGSIWCQAEECSASGYIIGGTGTNATATGGWAGYVNHADATKYPNACSATGDVKAVSQTGNSYTGGLIGQTVVSLKNCSSVGKIFEADNSNGYTGGLVGMIAADKLIYNSFSMSKIYSSQGKEIVTEETLDFDVKTDSRLSGLRPDTKTHNCHYQGKILDTRGGNTTQKATAIYLNNSVNDVNRFLNWSSNSNIYNGAPYLMYQQKPKN